MNEYSLKANQVKTKVILRKHNYSEANKARCRRGGAKMTRNKSFANHKTIITPLVVISKKAKALRR